MSDLDSEPPTPDDIERMMYDGPGRTLDEIFGPEEAAALRRAAAESED